MTHTSRKDGPADGLRCGQLAPKDAWRKVYRQPRKVLCNRMPGHEVSDPDGPHRFTSRENFAVLVEWTDAEVPSA
jgi:hypothetical protein